MLLSFSGGVAMFDSHVRVEDFPEHVRTHMRTLPGNRPLPTARDIERQAERLIHSGFSSDDETKDFVKAVCRWGGYPGIWGRILKHNTVAAIRCAFEGALSELALSPPDLATALTRVNRLKGLGTPSFASKHLRFMRPDTCPVLDSLVARELGYQFTPQGYALLARDCRAIALALERDGAHNPLTDSTRWRAADVDMALFAAIQGWK